MAHILALEPYYGGSHQAFLDGWQKHSEHTFTLLPLKAHHWKWRMRHASVTLAQQVRSLASAHSFDLVWCSSMCNVAEFLGLCPAPWRQLPLVVYFHENQLAYPSQRTDPRDVHFAFTNWTSACAATQVWFNSAYNRDSFLTGLLEVFQKLPDNRDALDVTSLRAKARVLPPGIDAFDVSSRGNEGPTEPLHLVWAARFEHDKGPELLLAALRQLRTEGLPFSLTVMGQHFNSCPEALRLVQREFATELRHFGYEPERQRYLQRLTQADVFISTAHHEFFGLSVLEAARAGCSLLLPRRLSYPELFEAHTKAMDPLFYDGSALDLVAQVKRLAAIPANLRPRYREVAATYTWPRSARLLDAAVSQVVQQSATVLAH